MNRPQTLKKLFDAFGAEYERITQEIYNDWTQCPQEWHPLLIEALDNARQVVKITFDKREAAMQHINELHAKGEPKTEAKAEWFDRHFEYRAALQLQEFIEYLFNETEQALKPAQLVL